MNWLVFVVNITIISLTEWLLLPSTSVAWLWKSFLVSGNFTGLAEQSHMGCYRSAHSNQPCRPWKMSFSILFKMIQKWYYLTPCKRVMKIINGPYSPLVFPFEEQPRIRVHNLIPSLLKHTIIGAVEKRWSNGIHGHSSRFIWNRPV